MISKAIFNFQRQYYASTQEQYLLPKLKQKTYLYIYKVNFQDIIVRFPEPKKTMIGFSFKTAQIFQKLEDDLDNDKIDKWHKQFLEYQGEIILGTTSIFQEYFAQAALQYLQQYGQVFREWLKAKIDQIFIIKEKEDSSFGYQSGLMMMDSIFKQKIHRCFQFQSWYCSQKVSEKFEQLIKLEQVQNNISYPKLFQMVIQEKYDEPSIPYFFVKIPQKQKPLQKIQKKKKEQKELKQSQMKRLQLKKYFEDEIW